MWGGLAARHLWIERPHLLQAGNIWTVSTRWPKNWSVHSAKEGRIWPGRTWLQLYIFQCNVEATEDTVVKLLFEMELTVVLSDSHHAECKVIQISPLYIFFVLILLFILSWRQISVWEVAILTDPATLFQRGSTVFDTQIYIYIYILYILSHRYTFCLFWDSCTKWLVL